MAKVEIEESELQQLKTVNAFVDQGLKDPKTRQQLLRVQKTLNPNAAIPELDAAEHVMESVRGVETKVDALLKKMDERDTKADDDRRTGELQTRMLAGQKYLRDHGYQDDGIKKVEDLMLAEGISSYAAAMAYFEKLNPPSAPADDTRASPFGSLSGNEMTTEDMGELWDSQGRSENWFQKSLANARKEFRGH